MKKLLTRLLQCGDAIIQQQGEGTMFEFEILNRMMDVYVHLVFVACLLVIGVPWVYRERFPVWAIMGYTVFGMFGTMFTGFWIWTTWQ